MVKWGVNMVVFSCYFMVPETPTDKKVPFFKVVLVVGVLIGNLG